MSTTSCMWLKVVDISMLYDELLGVTCIYRYQKTKSSLKTSMFNRFKIHKCRLFGTVNVQIKTGFRISAGFGSTPKNSTGGGGVICVLTVQDGY